jgi:hypothetical protein
MVAGSADSADEPVFSDGEGRFAARVPPSATLRISKAGFAPVAVRVSAGSGELQVTMSLGAVLAGLVQH